MKNTKQYKEELHPTLQYEKKRVDEAEVQFNFINELVWRCDKKFGEEWIRKSIWSYGSGIEFKELSEENYLWVKRTLTKMVENETGDSRLGDFKKESNARTLELSKSIGIGYILYADGPTESQAFVNIAVSFNWGLPDTCEVTYKTETKLVKEGSFQEKRYDGFRKDERDGKLYHTETTEVVKCNKPILQAVFENKAQSNV